MGPNIVMEIQSFEALKTLDVLSKGNSEDLKNYYWTQTEAFQNGDPMWALSLLEDMKQMTLPYIEETENAFLSNMECSNITGLSLQYTVDNANYDFSIGFQKHEDYSVTRVKMNYLFKDIAYRSETPDKMIYILEPEKNDSGTLFYWGTVYLENVIIRFRISSVREVDFSTLERFQFITGTEILDKYQGVLLSALTLAGNPAKYKYYYWYNTRHFSCETLPVNREIDSDMLHAKIPCPATMDDTELIWLAYIKEPGCYVVWYETGGFQYLFTVREGEKTYRTDYRIGEFYRPSQTVYQSETEDKSVYIRENNEVMPSGCLYTGLIILEDVQMGVHIIKPKESDRQDIDPGVLENFELVTVEDVLAQSK